MFRRFSGTACAVLAASIGIGVRVSRAEELQLKNSRVRFHVSETTGALSGGWCEATSEKCLASGKDHYVLETEKGTKSSDETKDVLAAASDGVKTANGAQELTLNCRNAELGISITKKYRLETDADRIYKDVTFDGPAGQLLTYRCEAILEPAFRTGGYYHRLSHSFLNKRPLWEAKYVTTDTIADGCNLLQVTFINLRKGCGIGFYRSGVNGRRLFFGSGMESFIAATDEKIWLTSAGWRMPAFMDFLREGYRPSVQTACAIFKGDQVTFHREYQQVMEPVLDEIDSSATSPEWVRHIKMDAACGISNWEQTLNALPKLLAKLNRGYAGYAPLTNWSFKCFGDWYGSDESYKELAGDKTFLWPSFRAELVKKFRAASPWIKCSVYTNAELVEKDSLLYKHHPDWVIRGKDGQPMVILDHGYYDRVNGRGYMRNAEGPAGPSWFEQLKDLVTGLDLDFHYMDGPLTQGALPDWVAKVCWQDTEGYDFAKKHVEWLRSRGGAMFRNNPWPSYSDMGYWEANWEGAYEDDWRIVADRLSFVKLYQRNHRPVLICCGPLASREAQRTLVNYWLAMGFCPSNVRALDKVPLDLAPYINARYEMENTELVDADVQPNFLTDHKTEIEAHTLRQGAAQLISVINHGPEKARVTVSADRKKLGLKADRRTMSWLIAPKDLTKVDFSKVTWESPIDHLVDNTLLRVEEKLGDRVEYALDLEPEIVRIILITQSPALVYSINGERTQCLLPDAGGADVSLKGVFGEEQRSCRVNVKTTQKQAEILILYPKAWEMRQGGVHLDASDAVNTIQVNMPYEVVTLDGERFLKVKAKGWDVPYDIYVQ